MVFLIFCLVVPANSDDNRNSEVKLTKIFNILAGDPLMIKPDTEVLLKLQLTDNFLRMAYLNMVLQLNKNLARQKTRVQKIQNELLRNKRQKNKKHSTRNKSIKQILDGFISNEDIFGKYKESHEKQHAERDIYDIEGRVGDYLHMRLHERLV